jgi:type I restriction-modification system DNA methylase subunit
MPTSELITHLLSTNNFTESELARELSVTPSTLSRWIKGDVRPRADKERKIRELANSKDSIKQITKMESERDSQLRHQFDQVLLEIRESLHRRGRFSSRNESLEEVCKLLLAQIKLVQAKDPGLETYSGHINSKSEASNLIGTLNQVITNSLPPGIQSTLPLDEFLITIKPEEHKLLDELCNAFSKVNWNAIASVVLLDLFNETFGKFLSDSFGEEKQLGQYLTPIEVVRMMVKVAISNLSEKNLRILLDPKKCKNFGYILDPSCGVGSFLVEIVHQLLPRVIEIHGEASAKKWLENIGKYVLFGADKSTRMLKIAVTHFAAIGLDCHNLYSLNSLDLEENSNILRDKLEGNVSLILSNPPFGAEFKGSDLHGYKIYSEWTSTTPKKIDSEILFIERYTDWLSESANCIVVIPDSILTNKSIFSDLRSGISNIISVQKVISFPQETFAAAGTTAKTSVIDFRKTRLPHEEPHPVYFAICKEIGFKVSTKGTHKQKVITKKNDIPIILSECFLDDKNITHGRKVDFKNSFFRWDATYHASLPNFVFKKMKKSKDLIKVSDVAILTNDRVDPRRSDGSFKYIEISDVDASSGTVSSKSVPCAEAPSRARKLVRYGDVLASTVRPEQKKVGIITNDFDDGVVCTTGFAVLRPINISSSLLCQLLRSDFVTYQLMRNNIGVAYPAVDEACFTDIVLPINLSLIKELNKDAEMLTNLQVTLGQKRQAFSENLNSSIDRWISEV